jgi:hypothetical protein
MMQHGSRALVVNTLGIASGGTLDMRDNDLIVQAAPGTREAVFAQLYALLVTGFNGGTWDGTGLTSTVARDNVNFDTALGIAKNSDFQYSTFTGQGVNSDSILVKFTYYGDADVDGDVDVDDQTLLGNNYGSQYAFWADGDFDYNNNVNADDLTIFSNNLGKSGL